MNPSPEQIAKLPKWAQDHIARIERQMHGAKDARDKYLDEQTPSQFYIGYQSDDLKKRRYIQADSIVCEFAGIRLAIEAHNYGNTSKNAIRLKWETPNRSLEAIAMVPDSYQSVQLIAKENMR